MTEIYDKFLSESQGREHILMFVFSFSFMAASKENAEEMTALPDLPSCQQCKCPQIQLFIVSPNLTISG